MRVEASITSDDNVSRSASADALSDSILGARVSASAAVPTSTHTRAVIVGFAGTERFNTHTGLSRNFIGAQGDFRYRASGEFGAATYGAFLRTAAEFYVSDLRDGYRHAFGLSMAKPLTDRVQLFGAIGANVTDAGSKVFDGKNVFLRGNGDWSFTRADVAYAGLEYRRGDVVSSAPTTLPTAAIAAITDNIPDDAFSDGRTAYRLEANTWIATVGYNHAFSGGHSVDLSFRRVRSTTLDWPSGYSASDFSYTVNQFSLAYLARF